MDNSTVMNLLKDLVNEGPSVIPLDKGSLLIAAAFDKTLNIEEQIKLLDSLAKGVERDIDTQQDPLSLINGLNNYLFDHVGLHGNESDYYDPKNSLIHHVLSTRKGIPITLSLIYIEIGRRLGIPLRGVGMPGHFLVNHEKESSFFIDTFHQGTILSKSECAELMNRTNPAIRWSESFLNPISNIEFLARILRNLSAIYVKLREHTNAISSLTMLTILQPYEPGHYRDRGMLLYQANQKEQSLDDLLFYLSETVAAPDKWYVERLIESIRSGADSSTL